MATRPGRPSLSTRLRYDPLEPRDVPAGFTSDGLPVGLQIVGKFRDDWTVLQVGYAFEQATRFGERRPAVVEAEL